MERPVLVPTTDLILVNDLHLLQLISVLVDMAHLYLGYFQACLPLAPSIPTILPVPGASSRHLTLYFLPVSGQRNNIHP